MFSKLRSAVSLKSVESEALAGRLFGLGALRILSCQEATGTSGCFLLLYYPP